MKKLLKILAISTMVLTLLVACGGKGQSSQGTDTSGEEKQTTFTYGEDITLFYTGDTVNKIVIEVEEKVEDLGLADGETVEDFYKSYQEGLSPMNVDVEYKINGDTVAEKIIVDMSKTSRENIETIWGTNLFIFADDGHLSYEGTAKALKDLGYEEK